MADDWEDWEDESFAPPPVVGAVTAPKFETVGQAVLAKATEPDESKFAGEDEEEEAPPAWMANVPKTQQPKETKKKYEDKGAAVADEGPLDDPLAEKLRQQRLVEEADFQATRELFGEDLLLEGFVPKSAKDFEDYAKLLVLKYLVPHEKSTHYKALWKHLIKHGLRPFGVQEMKDLEACLAGVRSDKLKEETAAKAAVKKGTGKKKMLNAGRTGGSAGLDDYKFDDALDDEYDFM